MNTLTLKEEAKAIRKTVKAACRSLHVEMGKGTSYAWIEIRGSGQFGNFTEEEKEALRGLDLPFGGNFAVIAPDAKETRRRLIGAA